MISDTSFDINGSRLMVLCPFVYLAMRYDLPPLVLQPSEVGSAHWVSIRALLSPALRTYEHCDIAERRTRPGHQLSRVVLRTMLGKMLFSAVELIPSESVYCSSISTFLPGDRMPETKLTKIHTKCRSWWHDDNVRRNATRQPLLLWGLTLGMTADFLGFVSTEGANSLWAWPTLSPWDIKLVIWVITYDFRKRNQEEFDSTSIEHKPYDDQSQTVQLDGPDVQTLATTVKLTSFKPRFISDEICLTHYFDLIKKAIIITIFVRLVFSLILTTLLIRKLYHYS